MDKLSNDMLREYFSKLFHQSSSPHSCSTRTAQKSNYYIHRTNLQKAIIGPKIWNNIPTHLKDRVMKKSFVKTSLKNEFY